MNSKTQKCIGFLTLLRKEIIRYLRIWRQTLVPPVMTMALYFVVFGQFLGDRIQEIEGFHYIDFIIPGLIMMACINSSFTNVASSFYSTKFQRSIEEILISPMPPWAIALAYIAAGASRGILVGLLVLATATFFTTVHLFSPLITIVFIVLTATVFASAGFINGLFANKWDDINLFPTFILTPLTYFGGVFYSIKLLPESWQVASKLNPILYMVNGLRYGFLGFSDVSVETGLTILIFLSVILFSVSVHLIQTGKGLKA